MTGINKQSGHSMFFKNSLKSRVLFHFYRGAFSYTEKAQQKHEKYVFQLFFPDVLTRRKVMSWIQFFHNTGIQFWFLR